MVKNNPNGNDNHEGYVHRILDINVPG
jgi:hypothetical protein